MTLALRRLFGRDPRCGAAVGLLALALLCASCSSSVQLGQDMEQYEDEMARLQKQLVENPGDAEALREIGVIYLRTSRYAEAHDYLKKAYAQSSSDPKTLFYLGLASEKVGKRRAALRLYEQYGEVPRTSAYRRRMEGRYRWITRQMAQEKMQQRLAREDTLGDGDVSPGIVAVFPLAYRGEREQYAPLGRGLSEMMTVDLTNVKQLRVVERLRLQALLDELKLAQTEYVDPETAPRMGRLLGAARLVGGSYNVLPEEELRLDVALANASEAAQAPDMESRSGTLERLFQLEKEMVFRVIERLDITLTPAERRAIEKVPTQNLQAFLAYSRGLRQEDEGRYAEASASYQRAAELDPNFEAAANRADQAASLSASGGPPDDVLAESLAGETVSALSNPLLNQRLRQMNENVGSLFAPGVDARQPATEAFGRELEGPPPPPSLDN